MPGLCQDFSVVPPVTVVSKTCEAVSDNFHLLAKLSSHDARKGAVAQQRAEGVMDSKQPVSFDPETVSLLRETLDEAWRSLRPEQRATTSRTLLAEGILKLAAKGERNPKRLRDAALKPLSPSKDRPSNSTI